MTELSKYQRNTTSMNHQSSTLERQSGRTNIEQTSKIRLGYSKQYCDLQLPRTIRSITRVKRRFFPYASINHSDERAELGVKCN